MENTASLTRGLLWLQKIGKYLERYLLSGDFLMFQISETFGPVKSPRYLVRLSNKQPSGHLKTDTVLYYVLDHASYIFTRSLRGVKGSDASNLFDEEIGDEVKIFSLLERSYLG